MDPGWLRVFVVFGYRVHRRRSFVVVPLEAPTEPPAGVSCVQALGRRCGHGLFTRSVSNAAQRFAFGAREQANAVRGDDGTQSTGAVPCPRGFSRDSDDLSGLGREDGVVCVYNTEHAVDCDDGISEELTWIFDLARTAAIRADVIVEMPL